VKLFFITCVSVYTQSYGCDASLKQNLIGLLTPISYTESQTHSGEIRCNHWRIRQTRWR